MRKFFSFFIESVFGIQLFISPVGIGSLIALFIYRGNQQLLWLSITIIIVSVVIGIVYAELVRKGHGTSRYAAKIISTPDVWPDEYPEEIEAKEKECPKDAIQK